MNSPPWGYARRAMSSSTSGTQPEAGDALTPRALALRGPHLSALAYASCESDGRVRPRGRLGSTQCGWKNQAVPDRLPISKAWTALAAMDDDTSRIRIGDGLITNVAIRPPDALARQA